MKKNLPPKKEKVSYIPLLQIQIEKEFEDELVKAILPYKEKTQPQKREGRIFQDVLQKHIWDPNFPHILNSPNFRLLSILKQQWLTAKDFYITVFWLWETGK